MNLLNKLTKKNLLLNKKRTIVTIVGIILSVALITALSALVISFKESMLVFEKTRTGDYHVAFAHVLSNDVERFKNNRYIEDVYFSKEVGYSKLDGIKNENKPFVYVKAYDFKALDKMVKLNILEGRLPQTSNEIVISKHLRTNGRVVLNVGDTIKLNIGKRLIKGEDSILDQSNPYNEELESFKAEYDKEYKIVGIIERPSYAVEPYTAPGYTFITCLDDTNESIYTAYVRYKNKYLKEPYYTTANIIGVDKDIYKKGMTAMSYETEDEYKKFLETFESEMEKARYDVVNINTYLISLEYQNLNDSSMKVLYTVAAIVTLIIMVTSIYCIKNSFNISITEKTKQYGMLASIGATRKQIKKNVLYEAFVLGLIAIPIGILSGMFAAFVLVKISTFMLKEAVGFDLIFKVSVGSILLSILLGAATIYLSAVKSARKASKISPIAAIRNSDDIKIKSKKIKSPKIVKKIFGIGGDVSYKNLKRNNKKYRTTVISIVVCVSVFISLYSFMMLAFKTVHIQFKEMNHNIEVNYLSGKNSGDDDLIKQVLDLDGINDYSIVTNVGYDMENPKYTKKYEEVRSRSYVDGEEQHYVFLKSLGDDQYNKFIKSLGFKYDDVWDKVILLNRNISYVYDEETNTSKKIDVLMFDYKQGDKIQGKYYDYSCKYDEKDPEKCKKTKELTVAALSEINPLGLESNIIEGNATFIVSDEFMKQIYTQKEKHYTLYFDVENADKFQDDVEKILTSADEVHIYNLDKDMRQQQSLFTLVAIFLYGFIIVIALIGITNIFNTITTSVELRAREFATLKSVGMTKHEFNKMVSLESIFYGFKSLIIGIPIGSVLSYLIYRALVGGDLDFDYIYPFKAVVISIVAVLILITVIMKYSINKISKQNTIETIRNDNI